MRDETVAVHEVPSLFYNWNIHEVFVNDRWISFDTITCYKTEVIFANFQSPSLLRNPVHVPIKVSPSEYTMVKVR